MQMAIDVAGFSPGEADQLRQAMGSKRSRERMERLRSRLYEGMAERGITGEVADQIFDKLAAFANFGFPESHSVSFAYLVYSSSWIKLHYPAAFCAALLNAQPMGFYSPHTLVQDARRHGVEVHGPDLNARENAILERCDGAREAAPPPGERSSRDDTRMAKRPEGGLPDRRAKQVGVRLGLSSVRNVGDDLAERIVAERDAHGPYRDMEDLGGASRSSWTCSRRWPPPARSGASPIPTVRRSTGAGRCGGPGRWPRAATTGWPGWSPACTRRSCRA